MHEFYSKLTAVKAAQAGMMQLLAKPWMLEPQLLKESAKDSLKRVWKLHWVGVAPEENTNES